MYEFKHETARFMCCGLHANDQIAFCYIKSCKELNYGRFVDPNILGAARLVHSDLRIYRISSFLLDLIDIVDFKYRNEPGHYLVSRMRAIEIKKR